MELQIDIQNLDFQQLIENCFNSVWIIGQEGKIVYGNKACLKLLNLASSHDLLHKSLYTFLHPDFHDICKQRLTRIFENHEIAEMMEQKMIRSDGEVINIRVMAVPFHLKDQVLAQVIIEDITERTIIGKKNLLHKAFFNLIKNALEAIQDQGKLRIEHYFHNGWAHIKVSDTGVGIPEEKLKILGTPFFSTKSDGTGLGLTQVFSTIHEHGGNVGVHSIVGQGTTFHVQLAERKG